MKNLVLAAALVAPFAFAVPALAQGAGDASGYVGASIAASSASAQAREFSARHIPVAGAQLDRGAVSSSAFSSSN
ncbi:hypothetical protein [Phreatobacter sp. AB_2022a]|uniref:hypothetical protein n=1 Tax=Phreatobacter sp. AB_2022a TaxID=3003134 RepID=UPI0022872BA6|nr:hypothetical protein [Phreatobacter sp. AB_2022a]MCZ0732679.1 hypothetical protein [Phreatobacter sp. AB_2022a]